MVKTSALLILTSLCLAMGAHGQTYPSTATPEPVWGGVLVSEVPDFRVAAAPSLPAQDPFLLESPEQAAASLLPPGTRDGMFQKINFSAAWMPQLENDSLGVSDLRTSVVLGLPFPRRETPIVITPQYAVRFLDQPLAPDLPARLHDMSVDFHHFRRVGTHWIADAAVEVGVYGDDSSLGASDAFRVTGRALAIYEHTPAWRWVMGIAYLNRAGANIIPVVGLAYTPNDSVKYELVFPRPRVAWRLPWSESPGLDERWFYVMGEFGGGVWAVERASGTTDTLTSRDFRIIMGLERKIIGGLSRRIELGYVFGRELEYDNTPGNVSLDDTVLVRAGITY